MNDKEARLARLAADVADGGVIDWNRAEADSGDEDERVAVRNLRVVSDISSWHENSTDESEAPTLELAAMPAAEEGRTWQWGSLVVLGRIGHGGFAEVYRAWDPGLEREVALKLLRDDLSANEEIAARIIEEGRLMARVSHPNVVTIYGADRHDGRVGLWMELIKGQTLSERMQQVGRFNAEEAAMIGRTIGAALAAVHAAGLSHGDIKAQNVMRDAGGRYVLMDFNAGRRMDVNIGPSKKVSGTPLYMPPESFKGQPCTVRGDIYGLGVLLHHMVSGGFPVEASSIRTLRAAHDQEQRKLLRDVRPDLPEMFLHVVEKATSADPETRHASAGALQMELAHFLGLQDTPPVAPPAPVAVSPWTWRRWLPAVVALAALITVAIWSLIPTPSYRIDAALSRGIGSTTERLAPGARVAPGDGVLLEFEASRRLYVYVLNRDEQGEIWALFPMPGSMLTNPLPAGTHRLPGASRTNGKQMLWQVTSAGGREHFLIIASPDRLTSIEADLAKVPSPRMGAGPYARLSDESIGTLRGLGGTTTMASPGDPAEASTLFDRIKRLSGTAETVTGVWLRQIELDNPAPGAN